MQAHDTISKAAPQQAKHRTTIRSGVALLGTWLEDLSQHIRAMRATQLYSSANQDTELQNQLRLPSLDTQIKNTIHIHTTVSFSHEEKVRYGKQENVCFFLCKAFPSYYIIELWRSSE